MNDVCPCSADIALIGLAVMGQNLILNMNDHGWVVCAFNRTVEKVTTTGTTQHILCRTLSCF